MKTKIDVTKYEHVEEIFWGQHYESSYNHNYFYSPVLKDVIYEDGEWEYDTSGYCYYEEIKKLVLLPQWGVYVTSHARNILLSMVYEISQNCKGNIDDIVYNDTDSIKLLNYES